VFSREVLFSSSVYKVLDLLNSFELLRKEMENEFLRFEPVTSDPKAGMIPLGHGSNRLIVCGYPSLFIYI
jgi:hypothetical protein